MKSSFKVLFTRNINIKTYALIFIPALLLFCFAMRIFAQDIPEEARKHLVRGKTAVELAKTNSDYEEAQSEFLKAIELAPEWSEPYYQLGILQDILEKYDDAINNLNYCLQLAPQASNAGEVQELIYKIEFKRDKSGKKQEIVNIMISGPKNFTIKGGHPYSGACCHIKNFLQEGEEMKAYIHCCGYLDIFDETVPVEFDGSVLKFSYMYYGCYFPAEDYYCAREVTIVAEMTSASPLRFKVKEKWHTVKSGEDEFYDAEWEFKE